MLCKLTSESAAAAAAAAAARSASTPRPDMPALHPLGSLLREKVRDVLVKPQREGGK